MFKQKTIPQNKIDPKALEGRNFRFVVSSAEDAAKIIRERLGETAKVLSVKQVNGKGLSRFLSSPQLEIIVTVPKSEPETPKPEPKKVTPVNRITPEPEKHKIPETPKKVETSLAESSISTVLQVSGFDANLIQAFKSSSNWSDIQSLPLSHGLAEITSSLKSQYNEVPKHHLTDHVAFLGTPGSGVTSALCKKLSSDVFINKKMPSVLKLEAETPNPDDALRVFCEVIGVPLLNQTDVLPEISQKNPLYVDVTGAPLRDFKQWNTISKQLDKLNVNTRVFVLNAAYDADLIKASLRVASSVNATHLVFSHIDEVQTTSKLWPFVLLSGLPVLFLSSGQDVTSDTIENIPEHLLQHSFPSIVLN